MSKKAEKKEEAEQDFNINEMYNKINPLLIDGLKRYIYANKIEIKNEKEFNKVYKKYGGF